MQTTPSGNMIYAYHGRSMWPTFQEGDLLIVEPVDPSQLRRGDCIVFLTRPEAPHTIHRIVTLRPEIWARGDARPCRDDEPVNPASIAGRVRARVRCGSQRGVRGGGQGLLSGKLMYYAGLLDPYKDSRGGRVARGIAWVCGIATRYWLRHTRTLALASPTGEVIYLMLGQKAIAHWDKEHGLWAVPWPTSVYLWRRVGPAPPVGPL